MNLEQWEPPLTHDPMVEEANVWDLSWGKILADSVLADYLRNLARFSPDGSLIKAHAEWLIGLFPKLGHAGVVPSPWAWTDLVTGVDNVGNVSRAREVCAAWITGGERVAYWTGGLEFTRSQFEVASLLLERE